MDKSALGMGKQTVRIGGDMPPGRVEAWPVVWSGWLLLLGRATLAKWDIGDL